MRNNDPNKQGAAPFQELPLFYIFIQEDFESETRVYRKTPPMTISPPRITAGRGISRNSAMPMRLANTGSRSLELEMNAALSYFRPQLKMLCPSRVQNTAMPKAAQ